MFSKKEEQKKVHFKEIVVSINNELHTFKGEFSFVTSRVNKSYGLSVEVCDIGDNPNVRIANADYYYIPKFVTHNSGEDLPPL